MCERVTIIETLEKMNSNLERIATALERAYPPVIIPDQKELTKGITEEMVKDALSQFSRYRKSESTSGYYNPITRNWEGKEDKGADE